MAFNLNNFMDKFDTGIDGGASTRPKMTWGKVFFDAIPIEYKGGEVLTLSQYQVYRRDIEGFADYRNFGKRRASEGSKHRLILFVCETQNKEGQTYHQITEIGDNSERNAFVVSALLGAKNWQEAASFLKMLQANEMPPSKITAAVLSGLEQGQQYWASFEPGPIPFGLKSISAETRKQGVVTSGDKYWFYYPVEHIQESGQYIPTGWEQVAKYPKDAQGNPVPTYDKHYLKNLVIYGSEAEMNEARKERYGEEVKPVNGYKYFEWMPAFWQEKPEVYLGGIKNTYNQNLQTLGEAEAAAQQTIASVIAPLVPDDPAIQQRILRYATTQIEEPF